MLKLYDGQALWNNNFRYVNFYANTLFPFPNLLPFLLLQLLLLMQDSQQ